LLRSGAIAIEVQTMISKGAVLAAVNDVSTLCQLLGDSDECVRWDAAEAIGELGDPTAIPALLEAIRDPCSVVRLCVADALGAIGKRGPDVTAALCGLLTDADEHVRGFAFSALATAGDDTAANAIRARLPRERRYGGPRMWAAYALYELDNEPFPFRDVMRPLRRGTHAERTSAAVCLSMIADAKTLPRIRAALQRALARERSVGMRELMQRSLGYLTETSG